VSAKAHGVCVSACVCLYVGVRVCVRVCVCVCVCKLTGLNRQLTQPFAAQVYKQKVKHLLYEHQNRITELKTDGVWWIPCRPSAWREGGVLRWSASDWLDSQTAASSRSLVHGSHIEPLASTGGAPHG
jgi:hypothetical protein